jgi:2,3-bisphosphoglycerate-independent phosphoglycerate mutase
MPYAVLSLKPINLSVHVYRLGFNSYVSLQVPVAIGGPGLHPGVKFRSDINTPGLANVAATVMNLHGFLAPDDYETTLIEVANK